MKVVKDLIGGTKPATLEVFYCGNYNGDGVTKIYKGSLAKVTDNGDDDLGQYVCWAGGTTALLNLIGILEEEADEATTTAYTFDDSNYGMTMRKITPLFPSTVVEAEYSRVNADGSTVNTDTGATASAASATFTCGSLTTDDAMIGGWIYFLDGANAYKLHYVYGSEASGNTMTFGTVTTGAVASGDTFLVIRPPHTGILAFDAQYVDLLSEVTETSVTDPVFGLSTWISSPGMPKQILHRDKHDGLIMKDAHFFHHFTFPGNETYENVWTYGIR